MPWEDKSFRDSQKWDEALDQHQQTQMSRETTLWNKLLRLIWRFGRGRWEASVKCIRGFPLWTALRYAIALNLWLQASEKWVKYWRLRWNKVNVQPSIVRLGRSLGSTCFWIQGLRNSTPLRFPFGISDCHQQNARDFARILYLGRACWLVWTRL